MLKGVNNGGQRQTGVLPLLFSIVACTQPLELLVRAIRTTIDYMQAAHDDSPILLAYRRSLKIWWYHMLMVHTWVVLLKKHRGLRIKRDERWWKEKAEKKRHFVSARNAFTRRCENFIERRLGIKNIRRRDFRQRLDSLSCAIYP